MASEHDDRLEFTIRGFSKAELEVCADKQCANYGLRVCESEIKPCMVTPGGRVRLYEGRFVATRD